MVRLACQRPRSTRRHVRCRLGKPIERKQRFREHSPNRIRGRKGVALRLRRLANEPLCRDCKAEGKDTPSTVPDHIIPLAQGGADEDSNIRCLCADHHRIRTAEQFGHLPSFGNDVNGRPLDPSHPWNRR
ncbi:HNH endonuclease [Tardiphaga alba]|uniref:HNH endonuclease n=1 Tax=Tardiphaga alba TaxID=340268 RepID=A0ABX8A8A8_9BRAD|nr:HNH endonuclease [Tardiphaga alba]